jgi:hypothetical protein
MQDFESFSKNTKAENFGAPTDLNDLIKNLAGKFDGKSENEILSAILKEAEKGRKAGTLKDEDIDRFASMLAPIIDDKKRKKLYSVVEKLKKQN